MNWIAGWITPTMCNKRCRCWKATSNGHVIRVYCHPTYRLVFAHNAGDESFILVSADITVERMKKLMENANA